MSDHVLRLLPARALIGPFADAPPARGKRDASAPRGVAAALAHRLATDPARPLLTFYDDATGERVEFSATTFDNWVAKTANMLVDTLGLVPGDRVGLHLPTHWMSSVILLAAWSAGMDVILVVDGDEATGTEPLRVRRPAAQVPETQVLEIQVPEIQPLEDGEPLGALFVAEDRLDSVAALNVDETIALSLRPLGGRMRHAVPGVLDYSAEVPAHGDRFGAPPPPADQAPLLRAAAATARAWELGPVDRVLCTAPPTTAAGLIGALLAPLVAGSSVVLCRNLDTGLLLRRIDMEKVTAVDVSHLAPGTGPLPAGVRPLRLPRTG